MSLFDIKSIFHSYESFKDRSISPSKIFRHYNLLEIIKKHNDTCSITPIGFSVERRKIFKIKWGIGKIKVFIWSQMHGNETTGTKSMFDIFHFFSKQENHDLVQFLKKNLTILYIPMLNPDGSEKFQRRNAINIDLNRDAVRLQSPEIQALFQEIYKEKPHILFNLHDQRSIYNVGNKYFNPAILSFLSPSVDSKDIHSIHTIHKKRSMGIIHFIAKEIQKILPDVGSVGRFSDEFYPTATGDNLQKLGYPCVLFEAGNYPKDNHKDRIRKYNTLSILAGFYFISSHKENLEKDYKCYLSIPENKNVLLDKIYRKVKIQKGDNQFIIDIGLMKFEKFDFERKNLSFVSKIVDIGDLSNFFAYEEFIIPGQLFHGKRYPEIGDVESFKIF
ncbi:M14 family zinc carboxypeptidase [Blattabacterium cuenoti]|uniref:M14 family zinc carboxypeptidase n=1 Tax=Blattabacterium cuenoti TaxID=1653831 RepID=UPI00163CAE61|nr:M14 family zinc carboxypeptidase [Blattabacterium cuenoti]